MADDTDELVEVYSRYLDERIELLEQLYRERKREEALTLCCVYIESLAKKLYGDGDKRSKWNFVRAILEFGSPDLALIHPQLLSEALKGCGRDHAEIEKCMRLRTIDHLRTEEEVIADAASVLSSAQLKILKESIWLGTVAAQLYQYFRNPLVHQMRARDGVILGGQTFRGFEVLYPALQRITIAYKNYLPDLLK